MRWWSSLSFRIRSLFAKRGLDSQLAEEVRTHVEMATEANLAQGMSPRAARRAALREFGNTTGVQERTRDERGWVWLDSFPQDLRYATRNLRKTPGFTAVVIVTLALGIGGNTAIFSVVSRLLLNPLPYPDADRIVLVGESPDPDFAGISCGGSFLDWQDNNLHFDLMAASRPRTYTLTGRGNPLAVNGLEVTPQFLSVYGVRPALGRDFRPADDAAGGNHRVLILGHAFWQQQFNGDPGVVGQSVTFDGAGFEIIGVLEPDALLEPGIDFLSPTGLLSHKYKQGRNYAYVTTTLARLKPDATPAAATAQLSAVRESLQDLYSEQTRDWSVAVAPLQEVLFGQSRRPLSLLLGAVGVVLLIACANVANLLLARTTARRGELALRLALGASRGRIIRQMLTESLLLAALGGAVGIVLGAIAIEPLVALIGLDSWQRIEFGLDLPVLGFALGASALTGIVFGLLPALSAARPNVGEHLKVGCGSGGSVKHGRLQSTLIIIETGLTVVMLVVAGLLLRSFVNVTSADPGFQREGVLTFRLNPSGNAAATTASRLQFADRVLEELETIPGIERAGFINNMPMNGQHFRSGHTWRADQADTDLKAESGWDAISSSYFEAMGMPLLRGRTFTAADNVETAPRVMVVNQALADRLFPNGEDPIGRHLVFQNEPHEIVGVVPTTHRYAADDRNVSQFFVPLVRFPWETHYLVRTTLPPLTLAQQVRDAVQRVNPDQPIFDLTTLDDLTTSTLTFRTMMLTLLGLFAGVALLLACIGIYGVMAYSVNQRTREMGIRLALGAAARDVIRLILRDGLRVLGLGLVLGAIGAGFATQLLQSHLYNVNRLDPATFTGVAVILLAVGTAACFLPARRAANVDPIISLRAE